MNLREVLIKPVITEKSLLLAHDNKYTFLVDRRATKPQIAEACKVFFNVTPIEIKTITTRAQAKRVPGKRKTIMPMDGKKAIVILSKKESIPVFSKWFSISDTTEEPQKKDDKKKEIKDKKDTKKDSKKEKTNK